MDCGVETRHEADAWLKGSNSTFSFRFGKSCMPCSNDPTLWPILPSNPAISEQLLSVAGIASISSRRALVCQSLHIPVCLTCMRACHCAVQAINVMLSTLIKLSKRPQNRTRLLLPTEIHQQVMRVPVLSSMPCSILLNTSAAFF